MPNGGFGCYYCIFHRGHTCVLRGARISNDHWTVCRNVQYPGGIPQYRKDWHYTLPNPLPELDGPIFSITSEGAPHYAQVPWLESNEVFERVERKTSCVVCETELTSCVTMCFQNVDYDFCSFRHYLEWRNTAIDKGLANDSPYSLDKWRIDERPRTRLAEVPIIAEVSTAKSRRQQNRRDAEGKSSNSAFLAAALIILAAATGAVLFGI